MVTPELLHGLDELEATINGNMPVDIKLTRVRQQIKNMKQTFERNCPKITSSNGATNQERLQVTCHVREWKVCTCGEASCETCMAEIEAIKSASSWMPNNSHHSGKIPSNAEFQCDDEYGIISNDAIESDQSHTCVDSSPKRTSKRVKFSPNDSFETYSRKETDASTTHSSGTSPFDDFDEGLVMQLKPQNESEEQGGNMFLCQVDKTGVKMYQCQTGWRFVTSLVDSTYEETGSTTLEIIQLDSKLSVSYGTEQNPEFACGMATLLFAEKLFHVPQTEFCEIQNGKQILCKDVYQMLFYAIDEGVGIYNSNFASSQKKPDINEIILSCSHLNISESNVREFHEGVADAFIEGLTKLQHGEILLLLRMDKYKALSAVQGLNESLVIYDSQEAIVMNPMAKGMTMCGGILYRICQNNESVIRRAVKCLQKYSGKLEGCCALALVKL